MARKLGSIKSWDELGLSNDTRRVAEAHYSIDTLVRATRSGTLSGLSALEAKHIEEIIAALSRLELIFYESPDSMRLREIMHGLDLIPYYGSDEEYEARVELTEQTMNEIKKLLQCCYKKSGTTLAFTTCVGNDPKIVELPFSVKTFNILQRAQIEYLSDLMAYTEKELLNLRQSGPHTLEEIKMILNERGLKLRDE